MLLRLTLRDRHRARAMRGPMTGSAVVSKGEARAQVFRKPYAIAIPTSGTQCLRGSSYGSNRSAFAWRNHFRNMSSVSIISVKPARLIFTVDTIEGGPDSAWP